MSSILDVLNNEQLNAVKDVNGPVIVFSGAGTGKTKTLTARVAYMISNCNIKPYNILAITFTKKATNEMKERLEGILDDQAKFINISTIHSLCVKILRRFADRLGFTKSFEIIDDEDSEKILIDILKESNIDKKIISPKSAQKVIGDYKNGISGLTNFIKPIYEKYQNYLLKNNSVDFDDLLLLVKMLFESNQDVLEYYQELYKYILVDEFQDTNKIQYEIIKKIADKYRNIFVVGDDDQSIYSFRGACVENMQNFKTDYPDYKMYKLLKNYRSHNSILKGANAVIKNNLQREPKELYSDVEGSAADIEVRSAYYYEQEVHYVINEISHLVNNGYCSYSDCAILYRNSVLSPNFEHALIEERIPYNIYGGFSYLKRKEVKDIISYLRFIVDPSRIAHFKRIINIEHRGIGDKTINKVIEVMELQNISIFEACELIYKDNPSTKSSSLYGFSSMLEDLHNKVNEMPLPDFFDYLLERTCYLDIAKEESTPENNRVENVKEFKSILVRFNYIYDNEFSNAEKIRMGLDDILLEQTFNENETPQAVTLSTIHAIKGLEFEVVFVVGLEEGLFPSGREDADIEEERRVAYVAFTRAKSKLYLTCSTKRLIYGRMVQNEVSRFLNEFLTVEEIKEKVEEEHEKEETSICEIHLGSKVNHKYFGYGKVISIENDFVQIMFEKDKSIKIIKKDYPHMTILD